jgi:predicted metal-dependent peptidase
MLSIGKELTADQRLPKALVSIMRSDRYVALASVLMLGDRVIDNGMTNTAATDGRDEWYNSDFIDTLTDAGLRALIIHECKHKMYKHLTTWAWVADKYGHSLTNQAMDYVINLEIVDENPDDFCKLPACALLDVKYRGMTTAQVAKALHQDQQQQPKPKPEGGNGGSGTPDNTPPEEGQEGQSAGNQSGGGMDDHDWDGAKEMTADEQSQLAKEIDEAVRQGALAASKMGKGGNTDFGDLLKPQVDWREALREFITSTCAGSDYQSWRQPHRKYLGHEMYMPIGISEHVEELVLAIDTSGSIGRNVLTKFMSEVKSVCDVVKPDRVRILYWGSTVVGDEVYENQLDGIVKSTKPVGGGGTEATCVPDYMRDNKIKPQAAIMLTDGHVWGEWGTWDCPLLWCVIDNKQATPDVGKVLHINGGDV